MIARMFATFAIVALCVFVPRVSDAAIHSFDFTGTVTTAQSAWAGVAAVGDPISGQFSYEDTLPDLAISPNVGIYRLLSPFGPNAVQVNVGAIVFSNDPSAYLQFAVYNDDPLEKDEFFIGPGGSQDVVATSGSSPLTNVAFSLLLRDSSNAVFGNDDLPSSFNLAAFDRIFGFMDAYSYEVSDYGRINFTVETLTPAVAAVPEPASLTIWGLAALGCTIGAFRRRKQEA